MVIVKTIFHCIFHLYSLPRITKSRGHKKKKTQFLRPSFEETDFRGIYYKSTRVSATVNVVALKLHTVRKFPRGLVKCVYISHGKVRRLALHVGTRKKHTKDVYIKWLILVLHTRINDRTTILFRVDLVKPYIIIVFIIFNH